MEQDKYYKSTREDLIQLLKEFGTAEKLIKHFDDNQLWSYKEGLQQELRDLLLKLQVNKIYLTSEIQDMVDLKSGLLNKRLHKLRNKGYVTRPAHGQWLRIK